MDEFGPDEQKWLDVLRASDEPSMDDRARVRAAVLAGIAAGAATGAATAAATTTAAAVATSGAAAKTVGSGGAIGLFAGSWKIGVALVSLALATAGGVTVAVVHRPSEATARAVPSASVAHAQPADVANRVSSADPIDPVGLPAPDPATTVVLPPPENLEAAPKASPPVRAPVRATPSHASPASRRDDVDAELVLLTQAQRALEHGDPNGALTALARHGREHPQGALALEREGLRAVASCEAKRSDGRALAERFVSAHPSSPLVARVRAACLSP